MKRFLVLLAAVVAAFVTGLALFHLGMLAFVRSGSEGRVPDLVGLELDGARARLEVLDFVGVVEREEHSAGVGEGRVLEQRPTAGAVLRKGRKVWLTVSLGVRRATVPNLAGLSYRQADIALGQEGFAKGTAIRLPHPDVPRGSVVAQDPPAGAAGAEGTPVDLLVSLGPPPDVFVMPDLAGRPSRDVEILLESHGIQVGARTVVIDRSVLPSTVLEHDPPAGSRVETGGEVDLVVSSRR